MIDERIRFRFYLRYPPVGIRRKNTFPYCIMNITLFESKVKRLFHIFQQKILYNKQKCW